jgi:hypothetical protein
VTGQFTLGAADVPGNPPHECQTCVQQDIDIKGWNEGMRQFGIVLVTIRLAPSYLNSILLAIA